MNKMRRYIIMALLICVFLILNITHAFANEILEDTHYHLIDECTGEYLDYEEAEPLEISLFNINDSKFSGMPDNEIGHVIESLYDEQGNSYVSSSIESPATLPSSVDLTGVFVNAETNESYTPFPPIASQGGLGSCVSFAGTYYQFTYEVNQLNRINSVGDGNLYSTAYVYNYINNGGTGGVNTGNVYDFLMERGCVKLSMFPYYGDATEENATRWLSNGDSDIAAMREALNTRVSSWYFYHKRNNEADGDKINGPNSSILTDMKTLLAQGKVLVGGMSTGWEDAGYDSGTQGFDPKYVREPEYDTVLYNGEKIICQTRSGAGGHQVTIVGYDDSIWVDLNEDDIVQNGERGAFKVINSWGSEAELSTFWILYDALNPTSSVPHDDSWVSLGDQRTSVFGESYNGVHYNRCFFINVENKKVDVVAELQYYLTRRSSANITFGMEITKDDGSKEIYSKLILPRANGNLPLTETCLYDISSIGSSLNYLTNPTKWMATVVVNEDASLTEEEQAKMSEVTFKITDNTGRILNEHPTLFNAFNGTRSFSLETDFMDRDINFDKEITVHDYNAIRNYVKGYGGLSYLQQKFADLDGDGAVTQTDLDTYYSWYSQL